MNRKTQQEMQQLMHHFHSKTLPENGLRYANELFPINADFSDQSLEQIDHLLLKLHHDGVRPNDLVAELDGLMFLMSISGYLCEVINHRTDTQTAWYNYHEAVKILPSDYQLPLDFFASMVAIIENQVCLPLGVLQDLLTQGEPCERRCESYVQNRCKVIQKQAKRDIQTSAHDYLHALENNGYMPGGNYYRACTDFIDFDYSIRSVAELDTLLHAIKERELLTEQDFAGFIENREKLNFLIGMTFYLGAVIARQSMSSVKWFDFQQYKSRFSDDPELEFRYEFDQVCATENGLLFPMTVVMALLFESNRKPVSCVQYVQQYCAEHQGPIRYFSSNLRFSSDDSLPPVLQQAFSQAGFLAAYASFMIQGSSSCQPTLLVPGADKVQLVHLISDNPKQEAQQQLDENRHQHPFLIYCEDIHAYPPSGKTDAFYLNIRVYGATPVDLTLIVPYLPKEEQQASKVFSAMRYTESDLPENLLNPCMAKFYAQAFEFIDAFTEKPLWPEIFAEQIVLQPYADQPNEDHLYRIKDLFRSHLNAQVTPVQSTANRTPTDSSQATTSATTTSKITQPSQATSLAEPVRSPAAQLAGNMSTREIMAILEHPNSDQQRNQALAILKTKALQHDEDAMQVMAYFYHQGKHVERNPKQALYYLIAVAKQKLDEDSFNTAMDFFAEPGNGIHPEDKEAEQWLLELASRYDQATTQAASQAEMTEDEIYHEEVFEPAPVRSRERRTVKKNVDASQWFVRICIALVVMIVLVIIAFKLMG